jgi:hypothetical protein
MLLMTNVRFVLCADKTTLICIIAMERIISWNKVVFQLHASDRIGHTALTDDLFANSVLWNRSCCNTRKIEGRHQTFINSRNCFTLCVFSVFNAGKFQNELVKSWVDELNNLRSSNQDPSSEATLTRDSCNASNVEHTWVKLLLYETVVMLVTLSRQ